MSANNGNNVQDLRAVGDIGGQACEDETVWWKPSSERVEEGSSDEEVKNPLRWWTVEDKDEKDDKSDKDDKDDKSDCDIKNQKNIETARGGPENPRAVRAQKNIENENRQEMGTRDPWTQSDGNPAGGKDEDKMKKGLSQDGLRRDPQEHQELDQDQSRVKVKKNAKVHTPTREEVEDHEKHHCPFKAWCRHCVRGRANNAQHRKKAEDNEDDDDEDKLIKIPRISMDYFFLSKKDEEAKENPMIAMVDESTGERYARAAGHKGIGTQGEMDWLIQDMVEELKSWGHAGGVNGHIIMKSDNEPAVKALRDSVGKYLGGRVIPENPPKGESQSNGRAEEAGRTARGFARVLKGQLEENAGIDIGSQDVIAQWLVRWSAMLPSRYLVGKDGRTAFERRR